MGTLTWETRTSLVCFDFVVTVGVGTVGLDGRRVHGVWLGHRGDVLDDAAGLDEEEIDLKETIWDVQAISLGTTFDQAKAETL